MGRRVMQYEIRIYGNKLVEWKFTKMARDATSARDVLMGPVASYLMDITERQFEAQGRRGGGAWKKLSTRWLNYKIRKGFDPRILHMEHRLRRSVTKRGSRYQILTAGGTTLHFGSSLIYAAIHQYGGVSGRGHHSRIPARPYIRVTEKDSEVIGTMIQNHLMRAWERGRTA
jgi:phage virion morphogenesis protein